MSCVWPDPSLCPRSQHAARAPPWQCCMSWNAAHASRCDYATGVLLLALGHREGEEGTGFLLGHRRQDRCGRDGCLEVSAPFQVPEGEQSERHTQACDESGSRAGHQGSVLIRHHLGRGWRRRPLERLSPDLPLAHRREHLPAFPQD